MQDRSELPPDVVYERVLAGLHLVAKQAPEALLNGLLTWRKAAIEQVERAEDPFLLRKRVSNRLADSLHLQLAEPALTLMGCWSPNTSFKPRSGQGCTHSTVCSAPSVALC